MPSPAFIAASLLAASASKGTINTTATKGTIKYTPNPHQCLESSNPHSATSTIVLASCSSTTPNNKTTIPARQLWRIDPDRLTITSSSGKRCVWVQHPDDTSDEFSNNPVDVTACKTVRLGDGLVSADGFQKLVFLDGTIVWRGQSKTLPQRVEERFCVEASRQVVNGSADEGAVALMLQHCVPGKPEQQFRFDVGV
ncbi:hypothetical protein BT63DRAFT_161463 [Microthyrium microscopicum]|uniref:Uncharacterized protein n=1 Tax=Microthyrium microscopicum TaxID=703497 RepID=A0A6A6UMZ7_9PEZI|nr:hypothetical protein BT63DRAFT_161463 [Microthyrium microscopicum]